MADYAAMVTTAADTTFIVLLWVVAACAVAGLIILVWYLKSFKHKFRIKEITGTKNIIFDDKAKEFTDSEGVTWWKLLKRKHIIQVPPSDSIDVTITGKKSVEAYYSDDKGYQFENAGTLIKESQIKDCGLQFKQVINKTVFKIFNKTVLTASRLAKGKYVYIEDQEPHTSGTDVLTTKQKVILVSQIKKAQLRKKGKWTEHLPLIIGATFLVIMLIVFFTFWEDITKPMTEVSKGNAATTQEIKEVTLILQEMIQEKQIVPQGYEIPLQDSNFTPPQ